MAAFVINPLSSTYNRPNDSLNLHTIRVGSRPYNGVDGELFEYPNGSGECLSLAETHAFTRPLTIDSDFDIYRLKNGTALEVYPCCKNTRKHRQ